MKRTWKTCIFAVLETCKKAELCSPYVGYHEKSRASSTRSEGRDWEWPIELSLWRLCCAARSRVLSRSLLRLPLEMESLLVGYVADREIDFPCFIIFEAFFGDWEQIGKSSLSVPSSLNGKKNISLIESLVREEVFSHLFQSTKLLFAPILKSVVSLTSSNVLNDAVEFSVCKHPSRVRSTLETQEWPT